MMGFLLLKYCEAPVQWSQVLTKDKKDDTVSGDNAKFCEY